MLDEAIGILQTQLQITTNEDDWGYESVMMPKEELDLHMVPEGVHFPQTVMTHVYMYNDPSQEDEYIVYFITDMACQKEIVRGLLVNDQLVWHRIGEGHGQQ